MSDRICRRYINKEWNVKWTKVSSFLKERKDIIQFCDIIMLKQCLWLPYYSNWNGVFVPLMSSKWNIVAIRCTQIITLLLKIFVTYIVIYNILRVCSASCVDESWLKKQFWKKPRHAKNKMDKTFTNISQIFTENVKQWCSHLADILSSNSKIWLQS